MKKIICLILALTCVFTLISCSADDLDALVEIIDTSAPTRITTLTTYQYGSQTFTGKFQTDITGSDSVTDYRYQRYALVDDASKDAVEVEGNIATVSGKVYYKNGKFSEDGETWFAEAPDTSVVSMKLTLDEEYLGEYTISNNGMTLTASGLNKDALRAILGIDVAVNDAGASLTVNTNGNYITGLTVSYVAAETEAVVTIDSSYTYNPTVSAQ